MKTDNDIDANTNNYIYIKSYINTNENKCKINPFEKIEGKGKIFSLGEDDHISSIKEKNGYTIIISHKINPSSDEKIINYDSLKFVIIKNLSDEKKKKIIFKEIKRQSELKKKDYISLTFIHYDFFIIDYNIIFLFIFLLNGFYLYKIYQNSEKEELCCEDINFENNKYKKYLFIGNSIDNDLHLEYTFLGKPDNVFIFFNFDLSQLASKNSHLNYQLEEKVLGKMCEINVKLKLLKRGINNNKFLYIEKDSLIFVYKERDKLEMSISPFIINYKNKENINKLTNSLLVQINEKMFIIIDLTKNIGLGAGQKTLILGIFEIHYIKDKNLFSTHLLKELSFKIHSENYSINYMSNKKIIIIDHYINNNIDYNTIYYIEFDSNYSVLKINQYEIKLKSRNFYIYEEEQIIRITSIISSHEIIYFLIRNLKKEDYLDVINDLIKDQFQELENGFSTDNNLNGKYSEVKNDIENQNSLLNVCQKKFDIITNSVLKIVQDDICPTSKNEEDVKKVNNIQYNYLNNSNNNYINYTNNFNNSNSNINNLNNLVNPKILIPRQLNYFSPMIPNNTINSINYSVPYNITEQNINNRNIFNQFKNINQMPLNNFQN